MVCKWLFFFYSKRRSDVGVALVKVIIITIIWPSTKMQLDASKQLELMREM